MTVVSRPLAGHHQRIDLNGKGSVATGMTVRRLLPVECERLMGFPDGYTNIPFRGKPASDSVRYKALGNSMAVPVLSWLGKRIIEVSSIGQGAMDDMP